MKKTIPPPPKPARLSVIPAAPKPVRPSVLPVPTFDHLEKRVEELEEALGREMRVARALRDVGAAQGTPLSLDQLLHLILGKITEALDADRATLYFLDREKDELTSHVTMGEGTQTIRLRLGEGIAGAVARSGRPIVLEDAYADPRFNRTWDAQTGYRTRTLLSVPIVNSQGMVSGVVQVLNKRKGVFTRDEVSVLEALASQAAVTIDHSRLIAELRQRNSELSRTKAELELRVRDLKTVVNIQTAVARAASLEELLLAILGEAMRTCDAKTAAVALTDENSGSLLLYIVDEKHRSLRRFPLREGQGLIGHVVRTNREHLSSAADDDEHADLELNDTVGVECLSAAIVPFVDEEARAFGAIAVYNKRRLGGQDEERLERTDRTGRLPEIESPQFGEQDLALVRLIAANAAAAIHLQVSRENKEREERLSTIGRLLSGVLHDLKTPLGVIRGYVDRMQKESSESQRQTYAASILKQFETLSAMQRDVLEFARGERTVLVRKVYLAQFFEGIAKEIEPELAKRGVELVLELQDRGVARFDELRLTRVVHNLARNAADAIASKFGERHDEREHRSGERSGKFTIRVARDKDQALVLSFSDNGPGIPKEIEHRLFQSFVTSGKKDGTGLGLAIVRKITEEHNGTIEVHSSSKGATFRIVLPQESEKAEAKALTASGENRSSKKVGEGKPETKKKRVKSK